MDQLISLVLVGCLLVVGCEMVREPRQAVLVVPSTRAPLTVAKCQPVPLVIYPFDQIAPTAPFDVKVAALLADRLARVKTEELLRNQLDRCLQ